MRDAAHVIIFTSSTTWSRILSTSQLSSSSQVISPRSTTETDNTWHSLESYSLLVLEMCRCDTDAPAGIAKLKYGTCLKLSNTNIHKCKVHNIAENNLNSTISQVDLCIFVIHVHSEFQLKMSMNGRDIMTDKQKLFEFFKSKGNNSAKNYSTQTKFELNQSCIFS